MVQQKESYEFQPLGGKLAWISDNTLSEENPRMTMKKKKKKMRLFMASLVVDRFEDWNEKLVNL